MAGNSGKMMEKPTRSMNRVSSIGPSPCREGSARDGAFRPPESELDEGTGLAFERGEQLSILR